MPYVDRAVIKEVKFKKKTLAMTWVYYKISYSFVDSRVLGYVWSSSAYQKFIIY